MSLLIDGVLFYSKDTRKWQTVLKFNVNSWKGIKVDVCVVSGYLSVEAWAAVTGVQELTMLPSSISVFA